MNKGIHDIQNVSLSVQEKKQILKRVMEMPVASPYAPAPTIWNFLNMHKTFAYALGAFLIFILTGGTLAYSAEGTVPGDLLYPVKVNVTEPIRDVLATTPSAKAEWDAAKAARRLSEAETLANRNKLTPEYRAEIEKNFNTNVSAFHTIVKSMATTTPMRDSLDSKFNNSINAHADILAKIGLGEADGEQHEVNVLEQTVLHAHQMQPFEMRPDAQNHSENNASSSREINKHLIAPKIIPKNFMRKDREDIRPTSTENIDRN